MENYPNRTAKRMRIYTITCSVTGKVYVGSASFFFQRLSRHKNDLRKGIHPNRKLQNAWNKYGEASFVFAEIEKVENQEDLVPREQYWIDKLRPWFNIAPRACSNFGVVHTKETRNKRSASLKKYYETHERVVTDEHKKSISLGMLGTKRIFSEEHKRKLSLAAIGRRLSQETKDKISKGNSGQTREFSEAHKRAIKAAWASRKGI